MRRHRGRLRHAGYLRSAESVPSLTDSMRCGQVKRRRLWAGLAGTTAVVAGTTFWAIQSQSIAPSESKAPSARKIKDVNVLLETALLQQSQVKDSKGAARTYQRVLEIDPRNKIAWYNLGVIAQEDDRKADARRAYDKALESDPKFTSALFNKALLLESGEPDRAVELLKRAIATDPKAAAAHLHLGQILAQKNRDDEARDEFRRAVAADPKLRPYVPAPFRNSVNPSPTASRSSPASSR